MTDYAYVAFLDILGYKEQLDADVRAGTQIFKDRMTRAFRMFENINQSRHHYKAISDSIFITCTERAAAKEFLCVVRDVYISFLAEGLMIRGGVSFGQHFENQSITYSPVLTKAFLLESEIAEFPRIMVDSNVYDMFPELKDEGIILRTGNYWFLNVVTNETFADVWGAAEDAYNSSKLLIQKSERVRIKHRWLQDFLIEVSRKLGIPPPQPYLGIFDEEPIHHEILSDVLSPAIDAENKTLESPITRPRHQAILDLLSNGPSDVVTISQALNLNRFTVIISLNKLQVDGKVQKKEVGNLVVWSLAHSA